ncbi:ParB/RepB/Spo0J family partition protein [Legionella pneumophila serogroup 1]|uniref:Probable chromosome-partitioning protein ParB n=2 Tax=Legionellaceae TaxID=444 RepID=A0A378PGU7_9GAMM|nr:MULTISPECIES: ParB/RepB/Spo0J family partition protein [Legionellaceae]MBN9230386.1 ParB/RepB/Spo0J family partition protein [Legionella sp.]HAT8858068.1 ParB/RepB/Spo0J family partition protein [Legionella pneumophila subsp. pneumophila]KTC88830.1 chromosome partitioning protein parB [Fluoribacter dumoffii NY 23]KTD70465.1 chromosome partitioning protein parB [Legionella steigerwaltii]MCK1848482.1 ParB/RepB/Spo0J family partition protein [Legionella pneumophila]
MSNLELKGLKLLRALDNSFQDGESKPFESITHLAVELLNSGKYQPRRQFDESVLDELASSIKVQGIIQPLIVRKIAEERYEIIAGERRWRAAKKAGLTYVPVIIRNVDDNIALAFSLIENIQRENLNPIEEALALNRFREEFHMTHEDIAQMIGRSRVSVTNTLRLLSLDSRVIEMLNEGKIDMGHARSILKLSPEHQFQVACAVIEKQLNVRDTEALANRLKSSGDKEHDKTFSSATRHDKCEEWSTYLSQQFTTNVSVKVNAEGKGKVIIEVNSASEVDWLIKLMSERG